MPFQRPQLLSQIFPLFLSLSQLQFKLFLHLVRYSPFVVPTPFPRPFFVLSAFRPPLFQLVKLSLVVILSCLKIPDFFLQLNSVMCQNLLDNLWRTILLFLLLQVVSRGSLIPSWIVVYVNAWHYRVNNFLFITNLLLKGQYIDCIKLYQTIMKNLIVQKQVKIWVFYEFLFTQKK